MQTNFPVPQINQDRATGKTETPIEKVSNPMTKTLKNLLVALPLAAVTYTAVPQSAAAQEACTSYTVQSGDTLANIAESAYGSFDYQTIFNANRNLITNPNTLETGVVPDIHLPAIAEAPPRPA